MSKFDDIKMPDNIDEVTKNAIRRGKTKKHRHRRMNKVASILAIGWVGIFVGFPVIVKALPNIESLITSFIESALPQSHVNKLKDESNANNIVVKDENAIITLEKSVLDSQIFVASMTIESDFLKQYDENDLRYNLYANTHISIGDKDNLVGGGPDIIKKIDENKATLKYSTVASGTDMSDPMQDITHHYTFGFDTLVNGTGSEKTTEITKYGVKTTTELDNKVALDGAQFKLFDANGKQLYFTSDGEYTTETSGTYDYIVSKNNGQLTATGLDAGTYTLKESKAPLGYALDKTTYTIVITPTYNELTGELKNYTVRVNGATGNSITFTHEKLDNGTINTTDNAANADTFGINNTPLITLPETGGAGMIALTVAAVVLMAGFGTMFVSLRKRKQVK